MGRLFIRHHHGAHYGRDQRRPSRHCNARFIGHHGSRQSCALHLRRCGAGGGQPAGQDEQEHEARGLCAIALGNFSSLGCGESSLGQRTPVSGGGLISSAGLIITVTDGGGEVIEREAGCATRPLGQQALSRMMVVDHSVRLRRQQASMVLIWSDSAELLTCSGGVATSEGTMQMKNAG
jgi:hypothetical protein